jgi:leader peptidase (prepilin peptidase)/N-methyltransferase
MESIFIIYLLVFIFGTVIGSFLNVVIDRIPRNESIIKSRSHCEHCRRTLSWLDLIPVVSYIVLRGRCRYCHVHIGYYYPIVEALTGLLFLVVTVSLMPSMQTTQFFDSHSILVWLYYYFLISCLIVIFFTDYKYGIIPFKVALFATIASLIYALSVPFFLTHILTALGVFGFFLLLFLITRGKGLGFGDVVYAFLMGLVLGYPKIFVGLYVAFLTGAVVSLILVWTGRKKMKGGSIPFGPFLVGGTIIGLFWGQYIMDRVLAFLLH